MKVAIYSRVSTTKQDYENQLLQLREYCQKQGWEIYEEYSEVISGKEAERPEFKRMLDDATKRKFDIVLVWALDRFTREGTEKVWKYMSQLESYKVKFVSYNEPYFNTENEMVRGILLSVMGALAKQERLKISERTKAGLDVARKKGKRLGRPSLSSVENQIIELHKQGKTIREIKEQVYYWDKSNHKKFVSQGFVHKTITKFNEESNSL